MKKFWLLSLAASTLLSVGTIAPASAADTLSINSNENVERPRPGRPGRPGKPPRPGRPGRPGNPPRPGHPPRPRPRPTPPPPRPRPVPRPRPPAYDSQLVRCYSMRGELRECPVRNRGRAVNIRLYSYAPGSARCDRGRSFGLTRYGDVWVAYGCRGTFEVTSRW